MESSIDETLTKVQEPLLGAKSFLDLNETKCIRFLEVWCNEVSTNFTNRTVSRKVKSSIDETLTKVQKTLIEAKTFLDSNETNCLRFLDAF